MPRPVILVVEDDEHQQEIYGRVLWYNGFDVVFARDATEGLELVKIPPGCRAWRRARQPRRKRT